MQSFPSVFGWKKNGLLIQAARIGDIDEARKLLDKGANIEARDDLGWTPLHYACFKGEVGVAKMLI